jgi:MFS transporter, PAT family, beta-lactamase induction signal transducer AmpG
MSRQRLALLWALYFVQGMPFGFQSTALPVLLRQGGASLTLVSLSGAVAAPWLAKPLLAPWVDQASARKRWMLPMQALMLATTLVAAALPPTLPRLLVIAFLLNLFAATLDIAVDGLAVDVIGVRDLGHANAAQVVGYKLGMLAGGGVWLWVAGTRDPLTAMLALAGLIAGVHVATWRFEEPPRTTDGATRSYLEVLRTLLAALRVPNTGWLLVGVATYKLGEAMADAMFKPFVLDAGFTIEQIGAWIGTWGTVCSVLGSMGGGFLVSRAGIERALLVAAVLRVVPLAGEWWLVATGAPSDNALIAVTSAEHFAGGALTTAMFALMMARVDKRIGATHFTALATVEVAGKSVPSLFSGVLADHLGYAPVFAAAAVISLLFVALVPRLRAEV